jgi:hypothetical protein
MGVERIPVQSIYQLQNEFGANGEPVWAAVNDDIGRIRFVGNWANTTGATGPGVQSGSSADYVEITFYGTGLNFLFFASGAGYDWRATVDGGAESGNLTSASYSNATANRNYSMNMPVNLASNLALGLHTVRLRSNVASTLTGFEVLNESSTLRINSGSLISAQRKVSLETAQTLAFKPASLTGTRGGRVVTYCVNGAVAQAVQAVDTTAQYLTSANHQNEEVARTYYPREFGAGRTDDFSTATGTGSNRAFTLDDGTTTLVVQTANINDRFGVGYEHLSAGAASDFITLTFVGTGLDITVLASTTSATFAVTIDGSSVGSLTFSSANTRSVRKICSGLPYGTHTVRFAWTVNAVGVTAFTVYQPKKPTLPSGAVELADYNVMADFAVPPSITSTGGQGVLRKMMMREATFVGAGWNVAAAITQASGFAVNTGANAEYVEFTFFGTGVSIVYNGVGTSLTAAVTVDGASNLSGFTTSVVGTGASFVASTGVLTSGGAGGVDQYLNISGMSLAKHTVRVTRTGGSNTLTVLAADIITPIHSVKSSLYADLQNTLPVGSQSLQDSRQLVPSNQNLQKAWAQAVGVTSGPTTSATVLVPCPDMSVVLNMSQNGFAQVIFSLDGNGGTLGFYTRIFVDGVAVGINTVSGITSENTITNTVVVPLSKGAHKIDGYWQCNSAGTITSADIRRILTVREL